MRIKAWRWAAAAALVALLGAVPALAGLLPTGNSDLTAEQLRDLVRASDQVGWEGLGESRADLPLPDVPDLDIVPALLGGTTRARASWVGPDQWRVDQLDVAGEIGTIGVRDATLTWNSAAQSANVVVGELPVRLPSAADLLAPVLGRRLASTPDADLSRIGERRIAGRTAAGLRLTPQDPASTTVSAVDIWVEPGSGLALQVDVRSPGQRNAVLTSLLLDLDLRPPADDPTRFTPPAGVDVTFADAPDIAAEINRFAPFILPETLAGVVRTDPAGLGNGGVAVYGTGFTAYAVVPLSGGVARRILDAADPQGEFPTPLVNGVVGTGGRERVYLLVGTVPTATLQAGLLELQQNRPQRINR